MISHYDEPISVITIYDAERKAITPVVIKWRGKRYKITQVAFVHPVRDGRILHHVFSVTDGNLDFRLDFNTENQQWTLAEVSDGFAD